MSRVAGSEVFVIVDEQAARPMDEVFCRLGDGMKSYLFATAEQAQMAAAPWSRLHVETMITYSRPMEEDYVLPAGALRLFLDLCDRFGIPKEAT
jgi:hypothetical protein